MAIEARSIRIITKGWGIPCSHCKHAFPPLAEVAPTFFESGRVVCSHCNRNVDLWKAACALAREPGASSFTTTSLGAEQTSFLFELARGEHKELDLIAFGVPADATLLQLIFTPQGGDCFPILKHANSVSVRPLQTKMYVFGMPMDMGEAPGKPISALVTWVRPADDTESWIYLAEALDAMASRRYWHVILPGHVAFETSLMRVVKQGMEQRISKERVRDFLKNGLTSSVALNIILPLLCDLSGVKRLSDVIRGELNRLRDLRNQFVHEGLKKEEVSERLAGELLSAAVFGFEYLRYAGPRLVTQLSQNKAENS